MRRLSLLSLVAMLLAACSDELVCPAGETACGGHCVSLLSDAASCGACGNACGAQEVCSAGTCACGPGTTACGDACVDLASDPAHCGACGTACGAAEVCSASACAGACGDGLSACDRACVDLAADRYHCGACGNVCAQGESCREGACRADLQVACFATDDVRAVGADLTPAGTARAAGDGPASLAIAGGVVYAASSISASITALPLDVRLPGTEKVLEGNDFEYVAAHEGLLFVANSGGGTVIVYDPAADRVLDEFVFGERTDTNPRAIAFSGTRAFVPLYGGQDPTSGGQAIGVVDLADLAACAKAEGGVGCGTVQKVIDLAGVAGAYDAPGRPFPSHAVAVDGKIYVTLANLRIPEGGQYYTDPAGPGRLAVVDTARDDVLSIVSLGACENPGALAVNGTTLWIACGGSAPGLLRVALGSGAPVPEASLVSVSETGLGAPGSLAFCGGMGYVTDQWSGMVVRFDPAGAAAPLGATVCPTSDAGWAFAADVACAP